MYKQLTSEQRYTISVLLQNRTKQKDIAKAINVSPSTVSRELRRNSGVRRHYNWETAQANAVQAKRRKPYKYAVYEKPQKGGKCQRTGTHYNTFAVPIQRAYQVYYN